MIGKKINQLATELAPESTDLTIIGDPTTGVSKKITIAQLGAIFSGAVSFYTNLASFPATGDINVIYCAKDTQKLYLWSGSAYVEVFPSQALLNTYQLRSEKGVSNGYASLDSGGKVPISQLPSSIMEYKGTWNAATNTPTLANGTGDTGDVYICNVAGTVNFGAGPITFAVGDYVIYSGTIWQRSSGAVGTVTSVGITESGDALTITGSPITTSGTINIGFAGNSTQYINGAGNLVTFPGVINEAQNLITEVYNKTGATLTKGTVVYINGGQGNLPTITKALATGDSTSAQTYGIVQSDITNMNNGYVVVAGRIGDLDTQAFTEGTQLYLSSTTAGTYTSTKQYAPNHLVYVGIVVRAHPTQGVIEVKIQNGYEMDELHNVAAQSPSNNDGIFWEASTSLWKNKSIATVLGYTPISGTGTSGQVTYFNGTTSVTGSNNFFWDASNNRLGIGLNNPQRSLEIYNATADSHLRLSGTAPSVSLGEAITGSIYQAKFGLITANGQYVTGGVAGDFVILSQTGSTIFATSSTEKMRVQASGNVSIGNTNDIYKLDVSGAGRYTGVLYADNTIRLGIALIGQNSNNLLLSSNSAGGEIGFYSNALGNKLMTLNGSGNLSIGNINDTYKLDVSGTVRFTGQLRLQSTITDGTNTYTLPSATGTLALTSALSGYLPLTGGTLTGALNGTTATFTNNEALRINPASGAAYINFRINTTSYSLVGIAGANDDIITGSLTGDLNIRATNSQKILFSNNNGASASLTLASSGAATFNATSTVAGAFISSGTTPYWYFQSSGAGGSTAYLGFGSSLTSGAASTDFIIRSENALAFNTNGNNERMRITSGGNVGIGTTSPNGKLNISNGGAEGIEFWVLSATATNLMQSYNRATSAWNSLEYKALDHIFYGSGTERMRITSGGKVCINTTTVNNGAFLNIGSSGSSRGDDLMTIFNPAVYGIRFLSATGGGSPNTSVAHMLLGNDGTTGRSINASGTINAMGLDYAEYMTKAVSENIAKGDIIGVDANGLLTNIYADAISFVVKSTDPSYVGGDKWGANLKGAELETARQKVDRVAFSGQVPCNVLNAQVGDYIIPINVNGKIKGEAVTNPTFEQYQISVGKVWKIMEDGRAWIAIKIG